MLNPETIKSREFQTTGRGSYRAEDVDRFFSEVSASYEQLFRENGELIQKISILANKVEEYRKDEDSLKQALLAAQKLADQIVRDAKDSVRDELEGAGAKARAVIQQAEEEARAVTDTAEKEAAQLLAEAGQKADELLFGAKRDADDILGSVNRKVTQEGLAFDMLRREASDFRKKLIAMYREHLGLISEIPSVVAENLEAEESEKRKQQKAKDVPETQPETAAGAQPETAAGAQPETAAEVQPETAAEAQPETAAEAQPETAAGAQPETAAEAQPETANGAQPETANGAQPEKMEKAEEVPAGTDGFKIDFSKLDFEEEEEAERSVGVQQPMKTVSGPYAPADDGFKASGEDDEGGEPVSFKSFFKKK